MLLLLCISGMDMKNEYINKMWYMIINKKRPPSKNNQIRILKKLKSKMTQFWPRFMKQTSLCLNYSRKNR